MSRLNKRPSPCVNNPVFGLGSHLGTFAEPQHFEVTHPCAHTSKHRTKQASRNSSQPVERFLRETQGRTSNLYSFSTGMSFKLSCGQRSAFVCWSITWRLGNTTCKELPSRCPWTHEWEAGQEQREAENKSSSPEPRALPRPGVRAAERREPQPSEAGRERGAQARLPLPARAASSTCRARGQICGPRSRRPLRPGQSPQRPPRPAPSLRPPGGAPSRDCAPGPGHTPGGDPGRPAPESALPPRNYSN